MHKQYNLFERYIIYMEAVYKIILTPYPPDLKEEHWAGKYINTQGPLKLILTCISNNTVLDCW